MELTPTDNCCRYSISQKPSDLLEKYHLFLPKQEELRRELELTLRDAEQ
jgi:hypothetical protein